MSAASPAPVRARHVERVNTTSILYDWGFSRPNSIDLWDGVTNKPVRAVNVWSSFNREHLIIPRASHGVVLLWALACEIDDRGATFTGDRVCRACSGRGWTFNYIKSGSVVQVSDDGISPLGLRGIHAASVTSWDLDAWPPIQIVSRPQYRGPITVAAHRSCPCTGPTRPDTVSLAWLVSHLAHQRSPHVTDWPGQWAADCDQLDADGTDTWVATWWRAFKDWTIAGRDPDDATVQALARALEGRTTRTPGLRPEDWELTYLRGVVNRRPERVAYVDSLRPWFDIGEGRVYADDIRVEPLRLYQALDVDTTDITIVMSCDVMSDGAEQLHAQARRFSLMEQTMAMTIGGEFTSYSVRNAYVTGVDMASGYNSDGRIEVTVKLVSPHLPVERLTTRGMQQTRSR